MFWMYFSTPTTTDIFSPYDATYDAALCIASSTIGSAILAGAAGGASAVFSVTAGAAVAAVTGRAAPGSRTKVRLTRPAGWLSTLMIADSVYSPGASSLVG